MKKKFLCLCMGVTMIGGLLAGCGSKEEAKSKVSPATYTDLKTATEEAYKDFKSGNIDLNVNLDIAAGEDTSVKGKANMSIKLDEDTAYVKINLDGFEDTGLVLDEAELYLDIKNELAYANSGDGWVLTEDASLESLFDEYGISVDTEDTPEVDIKEEDIKVETTDNGYVIKQTYSGKELMEMWGTGEDDDSLVLFASIIEGLNFDITAGFDSTRVLNDIDLTVKANSIDLGEGVKLDGALDICVKIADINKCEVSIPKDVVDSAKPNVQEDEEDFGEGFEIDGFDGYESSDEDGVNGSQFDINFN